MWQGSTEVAWCRVWGTFHGSHPPIKNWAFCVWSVLVIETLLLLWAKKLQSCQVIPGCLEEACSHDGQNRKEEFCWLLWCFPFLVSTGTDWKVRLSTAMVPVLSCFAQCLGATSETSLQYDCLSLWSACLKMCLLAVCIQNAWSNAG